MLKHGKEGESYLLKPCVVAQKQGGGGCCLCRSTAMKGMKMHLLNKESAQPRTILVAAASSGGVMQLKEIIITRNTSPMFFAVVNASRAQYFVGTETQPGVGVACPPHPPCRHCSRQQTSGCCSLWASVPNLQVGSRLGAFRYCAAPHALC